MHRMINIPKIRNIVIPNLGTLYTLVADVATTYEDVVIRHFYP
jgi:hypothetical protein